MKNIGLFISQLNGGGAERVVSHLSKILSDTYNVYVIVYDDSNRAYECGGTIISMNSVSKNRKGEKLFLLKERVQKLKKIEKEYNIDCVISFLDSPCICNLLAGGKKVKRIVSIRNYTALENKTSFYGKIVDAAIKRLYKRADYVVPVTEVIAQNYISSYGIAEKKIKTIYNPYNVEEIKEKYIQPLEDEVKAFLENRFTYISVGRFMYQKGFWHFLKAFNLLHKKHPDTGVILVGEDYSDGKVAKLIKDLKLESAVYLTGKTNNPYKYMKNANAYVLSSLFEGFPNAMTEGMICGLPTIAADCKSGPREILCKDADLDAVSEGIEKADFGILVSPLEQEEDWNPDTVTEREMVLARAMEELYLDKALQKEYSQRAETRGKEFSYAACKEKFISIIEN